ncbi:ORF6C domain-containing protein [Clostridium perfringens]|uniref:ORF6C domain-containing protein n=1 Tax=Clostridium perfringens TaxID=1502 RepID=UPI000166936C|nr:ORF6C domain-containing protein [Clostridium perfringens]AXH51915.1 hypothetical protein C8114_04615 [Clostridium perfringens]EDS81440.1 BRO domain protein [Clostridium perfringens C str. JGS1495]MBI6029898.1 ORF6C domain-containing protein [Clostridium perfringens]MBI6032620.1 ORF6C domain-containing protein [Clostridium perfringens]NGT44871.1 hypothetical protein [Clostridium perfringens]
MNNLMIFENKELGIDVRTIKNDDGSISINAEDGAIGLGWTRKQTINGKEYFNVLWARMNGFIKELGFAHECAKDDFIPESLFYLLAMKANNEVARKFQTWLAVEVIPAIRKSGQYQLEKKPTSAIDLFEAQVQAFKEVKQQINEVNHRVLEASAKSDKLEERMDNQTLSTAQTKKLKKLANSLAVPLVGGKGSKAYEPMIRKVYMDIYRQLFRELGVKASDEIKVKDFNFALEVMNDYKIATALKNEIDILNNQRQLNI